MYIIVEQAGNLVKSLQHRKEVVLKRRFQLRQAVAAARAAKSKLSCPPNLMKLENSQLDYEVWTSLSRQDLDSSLEIDQPKMEMKAVVPNLSFISRRLMHGPIVNNSGHHNSPKLRSSNPMSTSEIAITSWLSPGHYLLPTFQITKWRPQVWSFATLGDSVYYDWCGYWKWGCLPYYEMVSKSNRGCSHSPHDFWSSSKYLIHYQSERFCAHKVVI